MEWLLKKFAKIPQDKLLHCLGGVVIFAALHLLIMPWLSLVVIALAAVLKEFYDWRNPSAHTADVWDIVATLIGGLLALICWL